MGDSISTATVVQAHRNKQMTSRFVCTVFVVPTKEKAIILMKLFMSTLCGLAAPTQPRFEFLCVDVSSSLGVGECVFFQEDKALPSLPVEFW